MTVPLQVQFLLLMESLLLGMGAGLLYDVLRAIRWYYHFGQVRTALCDIVLWLVLLAAVFQFGVARAAGQNRFYVLAGLVGGTVAYEFAISAPVLSAFRHLLSALTAVRAWSVRMAATGKGNLQKKVQGLAIPEKIRAFLKKICPTPFHFWPKRFKINHKSVSLKRRQREWRK